MNKGNENKQKDEKAISVKKEENIVDWYSDVLMKSELADYSPVRGFMVIRPNGYSIWEKIQEEFNDYLKKKNIRNAYFPLLIPDSFFKKEAEHAKGFAPELAYVKNSEDEELLAIRPTSETIIYDSYSKWIRSYNDLPLIINQWCNVLRWEVKQTKPFLRTREFLWQEGHGAFETEEEAINNMDEIILEYKRMVEDLLAIPVIIGKKSKAEKFAGAVTTMTIESIMPDGKALQCGTSHNLGQGFSKSFGISFKGKDKLDHNVWQTSWGFSTRLIGALIMLHGDNKGLILPPRVAENKLVIVPILFEESKQKVLKKSQELIKKLKKYNPKLDDRENYSAGWKFNEWEMKGIPIRIEIGPKDLEKNQVTLVRRDNAKKESIREEDLDEKINLILEDIQKCLFEKAKNFIDSNIEHAKDLNELKKKIEQRKMVKVYLEDNSESEAKVKEFTGGATSRFIEISDKFGECIISGKKVNSIASFAKSY